MVAFHNDARVARGNASARRFRVVCKLANGSVGLVALCATFTEAKNILKAAALERLAELDARAAGLARDERRWRGLRMERWVGDATAGAWRTIGRDEDGFEVEFFDHAPYAPRQTRVALGAPPRHGGQGERRAVAATRPSAASGLRGGLIVECELLAERTRKNGWFAQIVGMAIRGPITPSPDMPADCRPGQRVRLKICGARVETGVAQFAWIEQDGVGTAIAPPASGRQANQRASRG